MGIKKLSKKLVKLARKAASGTGEDGKRWVEAVFETAIGVVEERLQGARAMARRSPRPSKRRGASGKRAGARSSGQGRARAKAGAKSSPAPKRARPRRVAPRATATEVAPPASAPALSPEASASAPSPS